MRFGSVASGIEAASQAFTPLGWRAAWFSEIDPFASKVLAHHHPDIVNVGDMTKLPALIASGEVEAPDVLCGGTPCQAFSVAGLRKSLEDARGTLSLTFCEIANAIDSKRAEQGKSPAIVLFENVPGLLATHDGAFGCLLGALAGEDVPLEPAGGKWSNAGCVFGPQRAVAWRVLDAQHFGVAQRRKRLFVIACSLEVAHPTQILFECESSLGNPEQGSSSDEVSASPPEGGAGEDGIEQPYRVANCLTRRMHKGINTTLDEGQTPILAYAVRTANTSANGHGVAEEITHTLDRANGQAVYRVAGDGAAYESTEHTAPLTTGTDRAANLVFVKGTNPHSSEEAPTFRETETAACLNGWDERHNPPKHLVVNEVVGVRRLLPVECERLMGFPDGYTDIPGASDTARYKALGNSWPVPVVAWIGKRIEEGLR